MDEDAYLGEIRLFAGSYAPRGWLFCEGQLLPISDNQALYALLGTHYGGNGRTSFGIPDLRGRVPIGTGSGAPGRSTRLLGNFGGEDSVQLSVPELPAHTHTVVDQAAASVKASTESGTEHMPSDGSYLAEGFLQKVQQHNIENYRPTADSTLDVTLGGTETAHSVEVQATGGTSAHSNRQPSTAVRYIISTMGLFPPRS